MSYFLVRKLAQMTLNGTAVVKVNEQKHLGLILQPVLSFEKHLKAKKNIGILQTPFKIFTPKDN